LTASLHPAQRGRDQHDRLPPHLQFHTEHQALATLAVQDRKTSGIYCSIGSFGSAAEFAPDPQLASWLFPAFTHFPRLLA